MKAGFYLHGKPDNTGRLAIYLRYSHNSEEFRTPAHYDSDAGVIRINPDAWTGSQKNLKSLIKKRKASKKDNPFRVKNEHPLAPVINQRLDNIEKEIYGICAELIQSNKTPFVSEVKNLYQLRNQKIDIWAIFDKFLSYKKRTSKRNTIITFKGLESDLIDLNEARKIHLNRLDQETLLIFRDVLTQKGNSTATIRQKVQRFKTFLNWAYQNELITNTRWQNWRIENQVAIHSALTVSEIEAIKNVDVAGKDLLVKNLLLFSCYTGLRKSEIQSLTPESENNGIITFYTAKVKGNVKKIRSIKLNELSAPIWEQIKPECKNIYGGRDIYRMKDIAQMAGVNEMINTTKGRVPKWKDVSPNTGRRTFITLSHQFGIPENFISLIVGHSRQSMTAHYDKTQINTAHKYFDHWANEYLKQA